jgi:hypothetical protein
MKNIYYISTITASTNDGLPKISKMKYRNREDYSYVTKYFTFTTSRQVKRLQFVDEYLKIN